MPEWNAGQYLRFAEERTRPCRDLAARLEMAAPRAIVDLGCGPGNSTAVLAARWPGAELIGLDSSPEMLATARREYPSLRWEQGDISAWAAADTPVFDVVFSNAALQWAPNHGTLFPRLLARARVLAVQMPAATDAPAQRLIRSLAASSEWSPRFRKPVADWHTHAAAFYYDALAGAHVDLWETDYYHVLDGPQAIVDWYRGTGLRPYLAALPETDRERFLAEYLAALRPCYPPRRDGRVLFPFRRLFLIASPKR